MTSVEEIANNNGINASRYWIKQFKILPPHQIGVVKASGKLLTGQPLEQLAKEMSYMANVGRHENNEAQFYLPLVIGGGVHYDVLPSYKNSRKVKGYRATSKEMMEEMLPLAEQNQQMAVAALIKHGANAVAIPFDNVFAVPYGTEIDDNKEEVDMGLAGKVAHIATKPIISAVYQNQIPVISHIGVGDDGKFYNINADDVAAGLVKRLKSKKLIFVGDTPVNDKEGKLISNICSPEQFEALVADGTIKDGMIVKLKNAYELLKYLGPGHAVQITAQSNSSLGLIIELLTNQGSGTMLTMPHVPHVITSYPLEAVDTSLLISIINKSFAQYGKHLVQDYFDIIKGKDVTVYMDAQKKGVAITYPVCQESSPFEYMCKIAIEPEFEGIGIATNIMDNILLEKKQMAWRASAANEDLVDKYQKFVKRNNGFMAESGNYFVFGVGIPQEKQDSVVQKVANIEPTLMAA